MQFVEGEAMSATTQRAAMFVGLAAGAAGLVAVLARERAGSSIKDLTPRGKRHPHSRRACVQSQFGIARVVRAH